MEPLTGYDKKHYLYAQLGIMDIIGGFAASRSVVLTKYSISYVSPDHGTSRDHLPLF